jgi:hypothetical protein
MSDLQFEERARVANDFLVAVESLTLLRLHIKKCTNDAEREDVQKLIDEGTQHVRRLGDRLLRITASPSDLGHC